MKYFILILMLVAAQFTTVAQSTLGYREKGIASFYAHTFHGLLTANGEIFDNYDFTAAHTKLPFNTILLVTNLENGKSTVVRVNDRGPFAKKRIIDLSRPAAKSIGMMNAGVMKVDVQELQTINLTPEKIELFKKNSLLDIYGKKVTLKNVSVSVWDSHHLEHVMYMIINLKLNHDFDEIYIQGRGTGKARRYAIVITGLQDKKEAQKIIGIMKNEGFGKARII